MARYKIAELWVDDADLEDCGKLVLTPKMMSADPMDVAPALADHIAALTKLFGQLDKAATEDWVAIMTAQEVAGQAQKQLQALFDRKE